MERRRIDLVNVDRALAIMDLLDSKYRAAFAGRCFADYVLGLDDWSWFLGQLEDKDIDRLKSFLGR